MLKVWGAKIPISLAEARVTERQSLENVQTATATAPRWLIGEVAGS
jgi:hypothetical protein